MRKTEAAYIAGFIDGEGSISMGWNQSRHKNGKMYPRTQIQISQIDRAPLDFIADKLGKGKVYGPFDRSGESLGVRPKWIFSIGRNTDVVNVLIILLPYLIVKRARAIEVIEAFGGRSDRLCASVVTCACVRPFDAR